MYRGRPATPSPEAGDITETSEAETESAAVTDDALRLPVSLLGEYSIIFPQAGVSKELTSVSNDLKDILEEKGGAEIGFRDDFVFKGKFEVKEHEIIIGNTNREESAIVYSDLAKYNVTLTDLDTVLSTSDIVSLHARTKEKEIILGARELDLMQPHATFINTARAYLVDYDHLAKMLQEKKIMGAALEVFPTEPLAEDDPFIRLDNVTLTNHRGGDTVNCYSDSPEYLLTALKELLNNGKTPKFYID